MERSDYGETGANGDLKEMASAKIENVREAAADYLDQVEAFVRERPATAVLAALGAGFLIGRLIRRA